jgi:hypothetical protein
MSFSRMTSLRFRQRGGDSGSEHDPVRCGSVADMLLPERPI